MKIPRTMRLLKEHNVNVNLILNYGEIYQGLIGHDLKVDECYTSNTIIQSEKVLLALNKVYSEPSCFLHRNFASLLPNNLFNLTFPCEVICLTFAKSYKLIKVNKLYFNPIKMLIDLEDSDMNLTKMDIVRDRKRNMKTLTNFDRRLEEFILIDDGVEFHTLKNIPSNFINRLNILFEEYGNNNLEDCIVLIRKLKKGKDYKLFNDFKFKQRLDNMTSIMTKYISLKTKKNFKGPNYTIKI
jgi:hypothetical protein